MTLWFRFPPSVVLFWDCWRSIWNTSSKQFWDQPICARFFNWTIHPKIHSYGQWVGANNIIQFVLNWFHLVFKLKLWSWRLVHSCRMHTLHLDLQSSTKKLTSCVTSNRIPSEPWGPLTCTHEVDVEMISIELVPFAQLAYRPTAWITCKYEVSISNGVRDLRLDSNTWNS